MGDNFSAFQRRVQSLKAPLLRVGPFISGAQWPQIRHNILRDHSQRGHASPRGGGGGPQLVVRGCCIHCFVETWSLGHGSDTQHYNTHSVVFVRLLMSQPGHNRRHGNMACSQPQPIFSFSFSLPSFIVSIISSHVHICHSAADPEQISLLLLHFWILEAPPPSPQASTGQSVWKVDNKGDFRNLETSSWCQWNHFIPGEHRTQHQTKRSQPTWNQRKIGSNFKNLNTHLNILNCFATTKNFALLGLNSTSQKRFWLRINKNNENIRYLRVLN